MGYKRRALKPIEPLLEGVNPAPRYKRLCEKQENGFESRTKSSSYSSSKFFENNSITL